jgi:predicted TIM-barrel fold metal-dependent hydrolase
MIIDSHCHAWTYWPYEPPVPDPESRGTIAQLLNEMDLNGVDRAFLVCAQIDHNPDNNAYGAEVAARYPDRIVQCADLDSFWSDTYHAPGAADRLRAMADRWPLGGFTHYLREDDDGSWLHSDEGVAVFQVAAEKGLIASIAGHPHQHPALREIAMRFPEVPILCHHLAGIRADDPYPHDGLREVLASASVENIHIKVSGYNYCSTVPWNFPYSDVTWIVRELYEHFGPHRLCWGSDYPVLRFTGTYRQALEMVKTHMPFIPEGDKELILGGTLARLLNWHSALPLSIL